MDDDLTDEQRRLWDQLGLPPPAPSGGQTLEQARNFAVLDFQNVCGLEGLPIPSDAAIRAEMDRRLAKTA